MRRRRKPDHSHSHKWLVIQIVAGIAIGGLIGDAIISHLLGG